MSFQERKIICSPGRIHNILQKLKWKEMGAIDKGMGTKSEGFIKAGSSNPLAPSVLPFLPPPPLLIS